MCWQDSHLHPLKVISPPKASMISTNFTASRLKQTWIRFSCLFCLPNRLVYRHQSPMHVCYNIRESSRVDSMSAHKVFHHKVSSTAWENCFPTHTQGVARHAEGEENDVNNSAMKSSRRYIGEGDGEMEKSLEQKMKRWTSSSVRESLFLKSATQPQQQVPDDNVPKQQYKKAINREIPSTMLRENKTKTAIHWSSNP